jgi:hypothetical protein
MHDAAIRIVIERLRRFLRAELARTVRRPTGRGGGAAWDLEYLGDAGERVGVLVRGTRASRFEAVDVSASEWRAARRLGTRYWLFLVTDVDGEPRVSSIQNPAGQVQDRTIDAVPTGWRLTSPSGGLG